jgi:HlyD family secretion protein
MRRTIIIILILIALGIAGFFGFQQYQRVQAEANSNYQTVQVNRGDLTATVGATGTVQANQSVIVNWQTSGRVGEVFVNVGDEVQFDQVLSSLDASTLPQSVILARADLVAARRNLENLQNSDLARAQAQQALITAQQALDDAMKKRESKDYARASNDTVDENRANYVIAQDAVSKAEQVYDMFDHLPQEDPNRAAAFSQLAAARKTRDRALANLNYLLGRPDDLEIAQADATVELAQAQLKDAEREWDRLRNGADPDDIDAAKARITALEMTLEQVNLKAPINGTITDIGIKTGDQAVPNSPTGFAFRIDDLSRLLVDVQITEVDINRIRTGQPAILSFDAIADQEFIGKVIEVARIGQVQQGLVNFTITIQLANNGGEVRPGMTAAVNIVTDMVESVLLVPNRAVRLFEGKRVVWVLRDGVPVMTEVVLGKNADTISELAGGDVREGDLLVLNPPTQQRFGPPMGGGRPGN